MANVDSRRGKVFKGKELPYGTLTMNSEDSPIRQVYYTYGYRRDEDMPPLPCIEPDDQVVDPEEEVWKEERRQAIANLLDGLPPREAKVLQLRFGIDMDRELSLEEVGDVFELSRERIRQIEARALRRLKQPQRNLREIVFPEDAQRRIIKDRTALRERMFEIEMIQMGWAWFQRKLNARINPHRHPKAQSWIEHIELTHPQLHRSIAYEVNRYLDDIFTNRLRAPHDDGRAQTQGRTQRPAQARL
jgi:hypothetical protein